MDAAHAQAQTGAKLKIDKFSDGSLTCLKFVGTIDEDFDGKRAAATIKADTLVLDLAEVKKISSFGIREWVDFVKHLSDSVNELFLIECSPKVVDQLNMVANFAGAGRVVSFYAPYRCDYCDADKHRLFQVDSERDAIKSMKPPERPCETCGNPEYFDEDATSFFSYLAGQPAFQLDPAVASFLAAKLNYTVSDAARRLRADKFIEGRNTYLKLAGNLDGTFPREKLAEGLEGTILVDLSGLGNLDPAGAAEWRGFLQMITPSVDRILLVSCPPVFVERLTRPEDLGAKTQVLSFAMPFSCAKCATTASQSIDVAEHYDVLKFATPPDLLCPDCRQPIACVANEALLTQVTTLPKPDVDAELRKFVKLAHERKPERPKIATTVADAAKLGSRSSYGTVLISLAGAALIAAGVVFGLNYYKQKESQKLVRARDQVGAQKASSAAARPEWILSDTRFSSECKDLGNGLLCVGVSSYADTPEEARTEAGHAALDALANAVGLKITDPGFTQHVRRLYGDARQLALTELDAARGDPDGARYDRAVKRVREGRKNVSEALKRSGGAAVPGQPSGEYWEEYRALVGDGSKFLVFVRYDVSLDAIKALIGRYATPAEALGARALTVFPSVAWRFPDVFEGAILVGLDEDVLRAIGLAEENIILSVRDRKVRDAQDFATKIDEEYATLKEHGGNMKFVVKTGDGEPMDFNRPIQGRPRDHSGPGRKGGSGPAGGTNIWDTTGGGSVRDNPNE